MANHIYGCRCFYLLGFVVYLLTTSHAVNILGIFPSTMTKSHVFVYQSLTTELASRGHNVTVISAYPLSGPLSNYTDIAVPTSLFGLENLIKSIDGIQNFHTSMASLQYLSSVQLKLCEHFLANEQVQNLIQSTDANFDMIIYEVSGGAECFMGFAHKFSKAHLVGIYAQSGSHDTLDIVSNPSPYAYVPDIHQVFTERMTFVQRLQNVVSVTAVKLIKKFILIPDQDKLMRKYFKDSQTAPYVDVIQSRTSLILLNTDVSLSFPRPYLPNVINIGGIHIKHPKTLPKGLKSFLDEAEDGVVYFSLGSVLDSLYMPDSIIETLIEAFSHLKQKVLWKYDKEPIRYLSANIRQEKWMPQVDVLAHKNVRVFLSHAGMLSYQEAAYVGLPMVVIPVNADQFMNAHTIVRLGFGIKLDFSNFTSKSLLWALNTVVNEPSYREKAQQVSARFRESQNTSLEKAVFWTEYVIRHDGAPHLQSAARHLTWYQYFMIDVIAFITFCLLTLVFIWKLIRK